MPEVIDECLIFGDIAGQFDAMRRLLQKSPDVLPVSVGDMIDRGPKSKEVVTFFQAHGKAVLGNHEHMCADYISNGHLYNRMIWSANGGDATIQSFGGKNFASIEAAFNNSGLVEYIDSLPVGLFLSGGGLVTHAPLSADHSPAAINDLYPAQLAVDDSPIWNRMPPVRQRGVVSIFGHNAMWGKRFFHDDGEDWAVCLDTSFEQTLTAMHWPSMAIYQEAY